MYIGPKSPVTRYTFRNMFSKGDKIHFPELTFTFMGRDAISLCIQHLRLKRDNGVLLPAYLCKEALYPFLKRSKVTFYDVRPDLTIDADIIERIIARGDIRALFVIHYFGFIHKNISELAQLCRSRGVYLIEDCAQSLLTDGSGTYGEVAIYSLRKLLPLLDGGGLFLKGEEEKVQFKKYPQFFSNFLASTILLKSIFHVESESFSRNAAFSLLGKIFSSKRRSAENDSYLEMSTFSKNLLSNLNLESVVEKRRHNFARWGKLIRASPHTPLFKELPPGVCPLGFPIKVKNRDDTISQMRRKGIELKVHWKLPSEIGKEFTNAWNLSTQVLTLPVYPELDDGNLEYIYSNLVSTKEMS